MIQIFVSKEHQKLVLCYAIDDYYNQSWVSQELDKKGHVTISKLFYFEKSDLLPQSDFEDDIFDPSYYFNLGEVIDENSIRIKGKRLFISKDIVFYNYPDIFKLEWFKVSGLNRIRASVFNLLEAHISKDIKEINIGDDVDCYLNWLEFNDLVSKFPTGHEVDLYVISRVTELLKNHTQVDIDYEKRLNTYREKRNLTRPPQEMEEVISLDIEKYEILLAKLKDMLLPENIKAYTEQAWQNQIAKIILLIFPQYLDFFEKVRIADSFENKKYREIDFLLISNTGNVDVLEIKRPTEKGSILRLSTYRENYVPNPEFSGTIMQAEKYLINLVKWGNEGVKKLNERYGEKIPVKIQINSPKALIITGYESDLNQYQINDIEIIKRKYANMIDIITYNDLIQRLESILIVLKQKIS